GGGHQHPELRAHGASGAGGRRRAEGRHVDRAPDSRVPRAAKERCGAGSHPGAGGQRGGGGARMSLLVVGLSHRSTSVGALERAALTADAVGKLLDDVHTSTHVSEAVVLAT